MSRPWVDPFIHSPGCLRSLDVVTGRTQGSGVFVSFAASGGGFPGVQSPPFLLSFDPVVDTFEPYPSLGLFIYLFMYCNWRSNLTRRKFCSLFLSILLNFRFKEFLI